VLAVSSSRSKQSTWWLIDIEKKEKKKKKRKMHCRPVAVGSDIGRAPTLVGMVAA
jgi:hypothetical protein